MGWLGDSKGGFKVRGGGACGSTFLHHILLPWEGCCKHLSPLVYHDQGVRLAPCPRSLDTKKKSPEHEFAKKEVWDGKNTSSNLVLKEGY